MDKTLRMDGRVHGGQRGRAGAWIKGGRHALTTALTTVLTTALAATLALAAPAAMGRSSFELRYLGLDTPDGSGQDLFNDGSLATGLVYQTAGGPVSGSYGIQTFSAGAERAAPAPDFLGTQFGSGGLRFAHGDAVDATSNLTPAGYETRAVTLGTAGVPGTGLGAVHSAGGFDAIVVWDVLQPAPGEGVLLALFGTSTGPGSTGTPNVRDRLQLSYQADLQTGALVFNFDQRVRTDGIYTKTLLEQHTLDSLPVDMAEVDSLALRFWRDGPSGSVPDPRVHAQVVFFAAEYDASNDSPRVLFDLDFAQDAAFFLDGSWSSIYTTAYWISPVPEAPASSLLLAGLAALAVMSGRAPRRGRDDLPG